MDDSAEAGVRLVGAHGDPLELLELAEEIFDEMAPLVHFSVDWDRSGPALMLGDDDLGAALVEIRDDGVAVEGFVGYQRFEMEPVDEWRYSNGVKAMTRQKDEAHQVAQRVGQARILVVMPPFERPMACL